MSLARRHRETHRASQAGAAARQQGARGQTGARSAAMPAAMPTSGPVASEYALLLAALGRIWPAARSSRSSARSGQGGMIGRYRAWVAGALASDPPVQDDIVGTMLVWAIDIGDWPLALELGDHVLAANLGLPERYKRSPAVLLAEESPKRARCACHGRARAVLEETLALTADHDMPDQVRAKLHKALGLAFQAEAEAFDPEAESQRRAASARWSMPRSTTPRARSCSTSTRA
jgi:hypothetical protein